MKFQLKYFSTAHRIAFVAVLTTTLLSICYIFIFQPDGWENNYTLLFLLIQFIATYLIFAWLIEKFVEDRIKLIYKSIYTKKKTREDFLKKYREIGFSGIEQDVHLWLQKRETELEKMKELEEYRREFLGNASHELKTPVFNIQGYISTLLDGAVDDPEVNRNYLERTEVSIERMISILNDLEVISRLENNHVSPQYIDFDLSTLIKEVFDDFEITAKENHVNLLFRYRTPFTPTVHADNLQVKQVITNLVQNSIRYRSENNAYVKITIYDMHEKVFVEVSDNGIGISESDLPRVFERFYRADKAHSREKGGSGLGLSIVKHIIEAHNQNITVRSTLGKGTTFSFTLDKAN